MKNIFRILSLSMLPASLLAQSADDRIRSSGFPVIGKIINTNIPGAPVLDQPELLKGTEQEIRTEKHGLAYPAFFDWNKDGKMDLLLGEFETGKTGSDIKVYLNEGSNKKPKFSGKYFYAKDAKGDTMTSYQWCCIGTHPRFADLDNDGYMDMLSGQYNPGQINWWRGGKDGFQARQFVDQEGYTEGNLGFSGVSSELDPRSNNYWNYTSAGFADFNGDGLTDLFVGGFGEMKVALNVGTKEVPKFGLRKYLLGLDGLPVSVMRPSEEEIQKAKSQRGSYFTYSGVIKSFVTPVDWDVDGVLDLLVTHLYGERKTKDPVVFFRGVQTDKGLRFEEAKSLFTVPDVYKTFPGCQPNIAVTDYNDDGVKDLVIGLSLPALNGYEIDSLASWGYLKDFGLQAPGKDPGRMLEWEGGIEKLRKRIADNPSMKNYFYGKFTEEKYLTLRHRGFVYVMLGKKNPVEAVAVKGVVAKDEVNLLTSVEY
ncbi:FG-GAP repeat domain-containing protein [Pseudobacter ginsenosidimutans]|uniref:VCBS repeat protein n=1 Tax=Pseudobacter ginsenosidimutans TaxID=661488 RepID=A0A4Q7MSW3_9BACT|nr:VCBS repeat-containing protein [Pseudobacter ginsenosidimutans]QEC42136.1 VCBS repeat-containing protein [Pseudobacter ginsenosidimutans]RZS71024.1 VCBS repeat protein [Pseudobacter ginsenosidimutans]